MKLKYIKGMKGMKNNKLKALAVALVLTMSVGTIPTTSGIEAPALTTTVEAAAKKVSLKASNKRVYAGKTVKVNAKATSGAKLSYKTSNKKIATVNSKGVITGKSAGTAKITITAKKSKYKTVKKTITVKVVKQNQSIAVVNQSLTVGQSKNLGAKAKTGLTYKSSNPKIVSVDKKGNLRAIKVGTAKITISAKTSGIYNKTSKTITIKVVNKAPIKPVTPTKKPEVPKSTATSVPTKVPEPTKAPEPTKVPNSTETPKPTETPEPTKAPEPTKIPDPTEAPVPTKVPEPTATPIPTATPTETPKPEVSYVTDLYIEKTSNDILYVGEPKECNIKWKATGNTTRKDFIYVSSNPSVATIDENGTINPLKVGKTTISVVSKTPFSSSKDAGCLNTFKRYTVKAQYNDEYADGVGFKDPEDVATKGRNVGVGETINPNEGLSEYSPEKAEKYLTFSSSDPSVATIDKYGNITGVSKGYVTFTVKTKLPVEQTGTYYKEDSVTYHVGDYTYEEILNGLTMDTVAGQTAHEVMNDLRQNPDHRNFFKDYPSYPTREWADGLLRDAVTRASRNVMCVILGGWTEGEMSTINPLASHGGAFNGYGGAGWEATGEELGKAASVFFEDIGHFGNETDPSDKYEAIAVVQYKNAAGVNLTSMIVQAAPGKNHDIENALQNTEMPHSQYYDICNHFGVDINDDKQITTTEEEVPSVGENEDIIFTDGSTGAADITDSAETAESGQLEEIEETEEFELSPEEDTDAISDVDVTFK